LVLPRQKQLLARLFGAEVEVQSTLFHRPYFSGQASINHQGRRDLQISPHAAAVKGHAVWI